jgi:hypothetical protein
MVDSITIKNFGNTKDDFLYLNNNIKNYNFLKVQNEFKHTITYNITTEDKIGVTEFNNTGEVLTFINSLLIKKFREGKDMIPDPNKYTFMMTNRGGYKKTYLVKELKDIAKRNNIKITKKSNGKDVYLKKQELTTKLEKLKLI